MNDCISNNVLYNDSIIPLEEANENYFKGEISIYEAIRIIDGCALFIEDHLARLLQSAQLLRVPLPYSMTEIASKIEIFIKHESIVFGNCKILISYNNSQSYFLVYQLQHSYPTLEMYSKGVTTKTVAIERENPNAKNIQRFHSIAQSFIKDNNLYEAILVDKESNITEGSKSNIFFIKGNKIITALASDVLLGITRKYVINAAHLIGYSVEERKIAKSELQEFDAAFISGTSPKILGIREIDSIVYTQNNNVLQQLAKKLDTLIEHYIDSKKQQL
jgi:branched-chain amino acid aminotransferase